MFDLLVTGFERELAMPPTEQRTSGRAICRIKDLLRRGRRPTPDEMKGLETLLSGTDDTELRALTSSPRHGQVAMRCARYLQERTSRLLAGLALVIVALTMIVVALAIGTMLLVSDKFGKIRNG